jgi:NADH-quinone oxidoreductase E subunit
MTFRFNEKSLEEVKLAMSKYPANRKQSAVMEVLYIAQNQNGWVSSEVMLAIAEILEIPVTKVKEVATFYTMYYKEEVGKFVLQVCGTTPCMLRGSHELLNKILQELQINLGETTKDGLFTVIEVECLGACSNAPVVQINNDYYEDLTNETMLNIIKEIRSGNLPKNGSLKGRNSAEPPIFEKKI